MRKKSKSLIPYIFELQKLGLARVRPLGKMTSFNLYTPSVNLFKGNEDFIEVVTEQGIRVGGVG